MTEDWTKRFEALGALEPEMRRLLLERSAVISAPAGQVVFGPGKSPQNLLLLLSGTVRVHHLSPSGREIVLYRVETGQSCILTTACLLADEEYTAEGITETEVKAVAIPRTVFDSLMARSEVFRHFVFSAYSQRLTDLFRVIEEVAFGRVDVRLAQRLSALARGANEVKATHQQLATELGTAREVVSRQLQEFQRRGWITQARGMIRIDDPTALSELGTP